VTATIEKQRGFLKRRTRVSYQKGTIVKKQNGRFLLRYSIRDLTSLTGWSKKSEWLKATTEKAAEKERVARMLQINAQNEAEPAMPQSSPRSVTFQEFTDGPWKDYVDRRQIANSTRRTYDSNLKRYILPLIGSMALDSITPMKISEVMTAAQRSGKRSKSLLNIYGQLRTVFTVAEEGDLIERSPVRKKFHRPNHEPEEKPAWSSEEVRAILGQIPQAWSTFFLCLALTTVRIGELLALTWSDVDWEARKIKVTKSLDGTVVVPRTKNRTKTTRHIPEILFQALQQHQQHSLFTKPSDFVFGDREGKAADPDQIRQSVLYPAIDRAGIERLPRAAGFHAFRHAASSIINELTGDLKLSQIQLGHKRISTTANIYTHANNRLIERAGEVLAGAITDTNGTPE
jgi:integrase